MNNDDEIVDIDARVDWAISIADDYIDNRLRNSPYDIPFNAYDAATDPTPLIIQDISTRLAGVELYRSRLMVDIEDNDPVLTHEEYANKILDQIHAGQINLSASRSDVTYPTIVAEPRSAGGQAFP